MATSNARSLNPAGLIKTFLLQRPVLITVPGWEQYLTTEPRHEQPLLRATTAGRTRTQPRSSWRTWTQPRQPRLRQIELCYMLCLVMSQTI